MKIFVFIIFCTFISQVLANEDMHFSFNKDNAKYWQYISDRTMGGVSNGQAILEKDGSSYFARLLGNVSTDNNGGFIQLRSTFSFASLNNIENPLQGVRIKTRGNGETYHIFIRTNETRSYSDFFYATFIAKSNWELVDLPFKEFKHRFSNKFFDGNDILTFAIVAYGRDFNSDVSVSEIIFYY